jgi:DUF4097 and DUF4098 domain-containing protein YvlB
MPREENMLILKMLQEGTITAEQAAELLNALDASEARAAAPAAPVAPVAPVPPVPPVPPVAGRAVPPPPPPFATEDDEDDFLPGEEPEGDTFARARAKIAAARERVAGVQEKLTAAEEKLNTAEGTSPSNPWESVADALKDIPGARAVTDALRDPGRLAANARRQARRVARTVRSSFNSLDIDINLNLAEQMQGEPTISSPREATAPIPPGGTLRVRNTLGDIEAQGADVPEARVAGTLKVWGADKAAAEALAEQITISVEQSERGPMIAVQHPNKIRRVQLDLKVFVPQEGGVKVSLLSPSGDITARGLKGSGVVLATQSGDARASEIAGDVAIETASGDIAIEGVMGNVAASTASGDIQAIRLSGQAFKALSQSGDISLSEATVPVVSIETVSGDAAIKNASGRTIRVRAVSGDVEAENVAFDDDTNLDTVSGCIDMEPRDALTQGTIHLATISGDVSVKLPAKTNAELSLSTKSGDVSARFLGANKAEKDVKGSGMVSIAESIGSGTGARINLSSVSGDLSVKQDTPTIELS